MTDMRKRRFTEQQIIGFLKQAESGLPVKDICRQGGFNEPTFYKWRARYGGMEADEARWSCPCMSSVRPMRQLRRLASCSMTTRAAT
jgi:hypothetical protein